MNPRKLNRVVIKEELVALTGCYKQAIILNQLMYWSERVNDFDKLIEEERQRDSGHDVEFRHGWIYKTAEELAEETLLGLSKSNMRTHLKRLIAAGWLAERRNPHVKFDNTLQYRVNFAQLRADLLAIGYDLHGYVFDVPEYEPEPDKLPKTLDVSNRDPQSRNEITRHESEQQYQRLQHRDYKDVCMDDRTCEDTRNTGVPEHRSRQLGSRFPTVDNPPDRDKSNPILPHVGNVENPVNDTAILETLSEELRRLPLTDTATLYDTYFDAIYAMLVKSFTGRLEPAIIRIAAEIYAFNLIDQPGLIVRNPVGLFFDAYNDALNRWKAVRYRNERATG